MTEYYVAKDGSIHRRNNSQHQERTPRRPSTRTRHPTPMRRDDGVISRGRKGAFWVAGTIVSLAIGIAFDALFAAWMFGTGSILMKIGSVITVLGSVLGATLFGEYYAKKHRYNLNAFLIVVLYALGSTVICAIATVLIAWILGILKYIIPILIILLIIGLL